MASSTITVVLPTFNRAPYPLSCGEAHKNPLLWALESLFSLEGFPVARIIIVDDASTDFTKELVDSVKGRTDLPCFVDYYRLTESRGSAQARNYGAQFAETEYILFTDDDCVFPASSLCNAGIILDWLERTGGNPSALNLPYYMRSIQPATFLPVERIGTVNCEEGIINGNFDAFPLEEADQPSLINPEDSINLALPLEVQNLGCTFLIRKDDFLAVDGLPSDLWWNNSYGEETELALRLIEAGKRIYFAPDPRCCVIHMKYGAVTELPNMGTPQEAVFTRVLGNQYELKQLIKWSNREVHNSGNRVRLNYWAYSRILAYFCIISKRSLSGGISWLARSYAEFVAREHKASPGRQLDREERESIWAAAVEDGINYLMRVQSTSGGRLESLKDHLLCSVRTDNS